MKPNLRATFLLSVALLFQAQVLAAKPARASGTPGGDDDLDAPYEAKSAPATKATPTDAEDKKSASDREFNAQLTHLITNIDSSIARIRKQITVSTNAPFLADLFLQLGELLIQKANTIYFIQAEKQGIDTSNNSESSKTFPMVISTQKEAAAVFDKIIKEFPNYENRAKAFFILATLDYALNDIPGFIRSVNELKTSFPDTVYAARGRILLGIHLTDKQIYDEATTNLEVVQKSKFVFERNMAKYRLGLVYLADNKPARALQALEEVILDKDLDNEQFQAENQSLMPNKKTDNLKREALLDSIRVYTTVHAKDPKPAEYYLRIAPNEALYVEVMERLAYRYIQLKQYQNSIEPLRVVGARLSDPEKVINIYRDVLQAMPPAERIKIPPSEMTMLLNKTEQWLASYKISPQVRAQVETFFEVQLRELGTKSHDLAKVTHDPIQKAEYLSRARDFYVIYLKHVPDGPNTKKMALDLADVYYQEKNYLESGDWYLRIHDGKFGAISAKEKLETAKTAVYVLQQPNDTTYYEQTRIRGLLLRALEAYIAEDPAQARSPKVVLLLLKTRYEQEVDPKILDHLYEFADKSKATPYGPQAAELILDYYGTRYDLKGLSQAAKKLQGIKFADAAFNKKLVDVERTSQFKRVEEKVIAKGGYAGQGGGKEFLAAALNSTDQGLKDAAFTQALASSRADRDIETYFKTALSLASQQKSEKKAGLLMSVAAEYVRVGRLVHAFDLFGSISQSADLPAQSRASAYTEQLRLALLMKDPTMMSRTLRNPAFRSAAEDLKKDAALTLVEWVNVGTRLSPDLLQMVVESSAGTGPLPQDGLGAVLMRKKALLPQNFAARVQAILASRCKDDPRTSGCAWLQIPAADASAQAFLAELQRTPPSVAAVEKEVQSFGTAENALRGLDGSGDPYIDLFLTDRTRRLNSGLGGFFERIAQKQPELKAALQDKINESRTTAEKFMASCKSIIQTGNLSNALIAFCQSVAASPVRMLGGNASPDIPTLKGDPVDAKSVAIQKKLLVDEDRMANVIALGDHDINVGAYNHAAALAQTGVAAGKGFEDELKVTLGCALVELLQPSEAIFNLSQSKSGDSRRTKCLGKAQRLLGLNPTAGAS